MEFSIGYLTTNNTVIKKQFSENGEIDTQEFIDLCQNMPTCNTFVISSDLEKKPDLGNTPYSFDKNIGLSFDDFNLIDSFLAKKIALQIESQWIITNNLNSIKNIFDIKENLFQSLTNGREKFFHTLWSFLNLNLAPSELRIIFKDLRKEEKKEILEVKSFYARAGEEIKKAVEDELDKTLLQEHDERIPAQFYVQSLKEDRQEVVTSVRIGGTPVLMMIKMNSGFSPLQESILTALFKGLENPTKKEKNTRKLH